MRPLQKKVDGNDPDKVIITTKEAFTLLKSGNLIEGLKKLIDNLDGIGIATASYIATLVRPDICPIMYDEVIEEITGPKIKYDVKTYLKIQEKIMGIVNYINNLNKLNQKYIITAEEVSRIIWIKNIMIKYS